MDLEQHLIAVPGGLLRVYTYRPSVAPRFLLLIFHGVGRDAAATIEHTKLLSERLPAIVISPEFPKVRFPRRHYQYGGVIRGGVARHRGFRAIDLVAPLVAWARSFSGLPNNPLILMGHSAGGQFLSRVCAYAPLDMWRAVIANPSTWVLPSGSINLPFGFGGIRPAAARRQALRTYLAQRVVVLLGQQDTGRKNLARSRAARKQGPHRFSRGLRTFGLAKRVAMRRRWHFGWTLIKVPNVGHRASGMFASQQLLASFN